MMPIIRMHKDNDKKTASCQGLLFSIWDIDIQAHLCYNETVEKYGKEYYV